MIWKINMKSERKRENKLRMKVYQFFKRIMDIVFSFLGLVILLPLLLFVAVLIIIDSTGGVLFKQERIGKNGKHFWMYKFRSMCVGAEKQGVYEVKGDVRVTRIGRFIRKTSIDEFPQFINILKGDMSIVGPRPTLTYHPWPFEQYTNEQKKRFNVRPGVTGWAQVNGRKGIDWNKRIEYDIEYVENLSFFLDVKIFLKTILKVLTMTDNINTEETVKKDS